MARTAPERARTRRTKTAPPLPVVGIGASAGGLAAVTELLKNLPGELGAAIVIVQHLDPTHGSLTTSILSRVSPVPVDEVTDGMRIHANHVYVIPPNHDLRLQRGVLKLSPRDPAHRRHLPIDLFFASLADDRKDRAIGVVLSGVASDGTKGVQAIKAEGGFTLAQDPASAQYDGMPRSAILSGAIDLVETPHGLAREITRIASRFVNRPAGSRAFEATASPRGTNGSLSRIFACVRNETGVDLTHYKQSTIQRRIARRLFLLKIKGLPAYASYLGAHPEEVKALFEDVLIHVTSFFRNPEAFEVLKTRILPTYMEEWEPGTPFRVWVPGCSSGEEAYSIAISFFEFLDTATVRPALQIFASDIGESSIQTARRGFYPESVLKDVSKARLSRFFERVDGGGYRIAKWIRDTCLFSRHDLTADPPFAKIDLIACRNVLIYFTAALQKRVVPVLHYALKPGGLLWLGRSETIGGFGSLFAIEDRTNKFYSRKTTSTPLALQFSVRQRWPELPAARRSPGAETGLQDVQVEADRVAVQQYAPPGVVITESADILQVRGRPAPYVELAPGAASLNLFRLVHPEVLSHLRFLVESARERNKPARRDGLALTTDARRPFGIRVVPFLVPPSKERYFSVFFEEGPAGTEPASPPTGREKPPTTKGRRSEHRRTPDDSRYHQELIGRYEATQAALVSSNEELQATNEELQSTNEELETAKEELQSANEEMTTINDELQTRHGEMTQLTNDLTNLLASVDIPIVMVGPDARIRRFTPRAGQILNLIPTDVGRSIGDVKPGFQGPDLDEMVGEVIRSLSIEELEIADKQHNWWRLQVRPYRTMDSRIDGAVISLTDITALKHAGEVLTAARDDARHIIETMPTPTVALSSDGRCQMVNRAFCSLFDVAPSETAGTPFSELLALDSNASPLMARLDAVLNEGVSFRDLELELDLPRIGRKQLVFHAAAARLAGSGANTALVAIEDVTARRETADRLRHTEERYRHLLDNAHDGIVTVDANGRMEFVNRRLEAMFGYPAGELQNQPFEILIPGEYREAHRTHQAAFMRQPEARDMGRGLSLYGQTKDGRVFPVEISLSPVRIASTLVITAIVRDISERTKLDAARQDLLRRETEARLAAEKASRIKDEFLATLSHELRTPLATILSWAQILRLGRVDPAKVPHVIAVIERSAKDQGELIDDLLDLSRIQAGKMLLELSDIEPAGCITTVLDAVRGLADTKSIALATDFDPSPCRITGDSGRLQQVFRNLITNAIKFTPAGGTITVRTRQTQTPPQLDIRVEDTGKGIAPEFLPFLFTRFSQEDSSTKRVYGGLGLGLSIVRDLVEMHGGTVTAASEGEGKGSAFTVTLPCVSRGQARHDRRNRDSRKRAPGETLQPTALAGVRVLVVDDLEDARDAFSVMLQAAGAQVETAASAAAGLAALPRFAPDVVLCDIAMPGDDGLSFIRTVRARLPDQGGATPAIALTAFAGAEMARHSLEAGFDAHLAKPADAVELTRLIAQLARGAHAGL